METAEIPAGEAITPARRLGRLLQAARIRSGMTQERLAELAGSTQQWVSRVERGRTDPRFGDAERLFAALGRRLVLQTAIARPDDLDPDRLPAAVVADETVSFAEMHSYVWRRFQSVPYLVGGRFAALCHGLPIRPLVLELVIADGDRVACDGALQWFGTVRWSDRHQDFTNYDTDLTSPGPLRFRTGAGFELRFAVVAELPEPVLIEIAGRTIPVLPLPDLLRTDLEVATLAARLASAGDPPVIPP